MILKGSCFAPVEIDIDDPKVGVRDCGGDLQSLHNWPNCKKFVCLECSAEIHYDSKHQGTIVGYHKGCDLCGWKKPPFHEHAGRKLCHQCFVGEVENPEHAFPMKVSYARGNRP